MDTPGCSKYQRTRVLKIGRKLAQPGPLYAERQQGTYPVHYTIKVALKPLHI